MFRFSAIIPNLCTITKIPLPGTVLAQYCIVVHKGGKGERSTYLFLGRSGLSSLLDHLNCLIELPVLSGRLQ